MNERKQTPLGYLLALLCLANFLCYANRNVIYTMYDDFRVVFAASNAQIGLLTTSFMVVHAIATVGFGWLSDTGDRRRVLGGGLFIWSVASMLSGLSAEMGDLLLSRALAGLGTGACVPVANALICDYVPEGKKARAVAIFNMGLFLGGAVGSFVGEKLGFPMAFFSLGAPGFAIAVLIVTIPLGPMGVERTTMFAGGVLGRKLWRIPTYRWTVLGATLMAFSAGAYIGWFFDFLEKVKGAGENEALFILGVSLVTGLAGVITGGALGDFLKRRVGYGRQAAVVFGMSVSVPLALLAIYLPLGPAFYGASWLLMFTISFYHGPLAASVDDLVPPRRAGLAQGVYIAIMHLCGTAPAVYLVGRLADTVGLQDAFLLPTATMVLAAASFAASFRGVGQDLVVNSP